MGEEMKRKAIELSDDEAASAAGGRDRDPETFMSGTHKCDHCKKVYNYTTTKREYIPPCPYCRFNPMTGKIE